MGKRLQVTVQLLPGTCLNCLETMFLEGTGYFLVKALALKLSLKRRNLIERAKDEQEKRERREEEERTKRN